MKIYKLRELCGYAYECAMKNIIGLNIGEIANFEKLEQFAEKYNFDENGNIIIKLKGERKMKTVNLTFEDFRKENMMGETVKAVIEEYNGGRYGRNGEYVAIIKPKFFKNGRIIRSNFDVVEKLETITKGYAASGNATHTERIGSIIIEN